MDFQWTPEYDIFLKEKYEKIGTVKCANKLSCSTHTILKHAKKLNLFVKPRKNFTEKEIQIIKDNYQQKGAEFCAKLLNRSKNSVSKKAAEEGLKISKEVHIQLQSKATYKSPDKYKVNPLPFIHPATPNVAYLLGFIYSDGNVYYRNEKGNRISHISMRCAANDILAIKDIIDSTGKWSYDFYKKENIKNATKDVIRAHTSNRILAEHLKKFDYCIKSGANADKILSIIPDHLQHYFFLGIIDGDGCWHYSRNLNKRNCYQKHRIFSISSTIDQDWSYIEKLLNKLNISYRIIRRVVKLGGTSTITVSRKADINKLHNYLYPKGFEFGLKRKFIKSLICFEDHLQKIDELHKEWEAMPK
jgi:hypothetical protein